MAQNRSSAVMAQRIEPGDSLDYFPTPPWATRALCERLEKKSPLHLQSVWEPACGEGHMARPLAEYFDRVHATDVHDYGWTGQARICDFLIDWDHGRDEAGDPYDWIITNPPFRLAEDFIRMALSYARIGCAVLVRTAFLEGQGRYNDLFSTLPPWRILQFTERVGMFKGRLDPMASTATSYCWMVWLTIGDTVTEFEWIAPCRKRLELTADYPPVNPVAEPMALFEGRP